MATPSGGDSARSSEGTGSRSEAITRARFLKLVSGAAGAAALGGAGYGAVRLAGGSPPRPRKPAPPAPVQVLRSRPDLRPPGVSVDGPGQGDGYVLLSPSIKAGAHVQAEPGLLIADGSGEPVWFRPSGGKAVTNFKVSSSAGQPVLSWWEGKITSAGYGHGEGVIMDSGYRRLARVRAGNSREADLHELVLTPQGTALMTCFPRTVVADARAVGGPADGEVLENIIQEVDLRSGKVLLEWHSLDHVPVGDSYRPYVAPYDYLHLNSIDIAPDGHLLVSARHTWALYKLHRRTGQVIWTLGGKRSDFQLDSDARFSWQHDARQLSADTITLFDDGSDGPVKTESRSRGLMLRMDSGRRVRLQRAYEHPRQQLLAAAMGNLQVLPNGNLVVGWGTAPYATEFTPAGELVSDVQFPAGLYSYRAFRYPWSGTPAEAPAIAVSKGPGPARNRSSGGSGAARDARSSPLAYVSWNGATELAYWQVHLGSHPRALRPGPVVPRRGFETEIPLPRADGFVKASALDHRGRPLGASDPVSL